MDGNEMEYRIIPDCPKGIKNENEYLGYMETHSDSTESVCTGCHNFIYLDGICGCRYMM